MSQFKCLLIFELWRRNPGFGLAAPKRTAEDQHALWRGGQMGFDKVIRVRELQVLAGGR
jgi:hypothetical protein